MKINFVTEPEDRTWILRRWCNEWSARIDYSTITDRPEPGADVHVYVNYALYKKTNAIDIAYFTHKEKSYPLSGLFEQVAEQADWCFAQSAYTVKMLKPHTDKITKVRPGVDSIFQPPRPLIIGIVGRDYPSGRKRTHWISELKHQVPNTHFIWTDGKYGFHEMPSFYESVDYILITAEIEGGPMPVAEALSMYKPVIAPVGVGWCDEFTCLRYETLDDLIELIRNLHVGIDTWDVSTLLIKDTAKQLLAGAEPKYKAL